ncbi:MAG: xanthine phosphoribosyltransferase [Rhodobacteraceae bacterium]|nr:xanthine phosphoribosyltransferase [Paracoccaceae bacterium]
MHQLPHEKGFVVSWDQLHRDCRALAWRLEGAQPEPGYWKRVIAVTRGGLAPAMIVARELEIRTVDTISVESYNHQNQSEPKVVKDAILADGPGTLVIDDLVDTGKTLELVKVIFPTAHFATTYAKPMGRSVVDTFITEVSQDTWIYFPWDTALQYVGPYKKSS